MWAIAGCGDKRTASTGTQWTRKEVAAVFEARAKLTNFISALQSPASNVTFFQICAALPPKTGHEVEFVWGNVWKYDGVFFCSAVVGDHPRIGWTNNEQFGVPATNIIDWMYASPTGMAGRFLDKARR